MRCAEPWIEPMPYHERNRIDLSHLDDGGRARHLRLSACLAPLRATPTAVTASADMIPRSFHQRLNTPNQHAVSAST
jgi:hypothetical protein